jgi:tetrapyrrole methylase family protein/MazG family protein
MSGFERLVELVAHLRSSEGCPWDRAQTHESLKGMLLEEAYEAIAAIDKGDPESLKDELGDLLLHVVFHSQIAREAGEFTIEDVLNKLNEKLIRRHPHVFGRQREEDVEEIRQRWEEIKQGEGKRVEVDEHLPALLAARKVQERLGNLGRGKVSYDGLKALLGPGDPEEEVGRLLFRAVALARELGVEPELALRRATEDFLKGS